MLGQRFHIYVSKGGGEWRKGSGQKVWSLDLARAGGDEALPWMAELANDLRLFPHDLSTGVIMGSDVIGQVTRREDGMHQ